MPTRLASLDEHARVDRLCELNVVEQVKHVARTTIVQDAWQRGQSLTLHGWVYGISDGLVKDLRIEADSAAKLERTTRRRWTPSHARDVDRASNVAKSFAGPRPRVVFANVTLTSRAASWSRSWANPASGKSTLLNIIAGLDRAGRGNGRIDGLDLSALDDDALTLLRRQHMGFVFQAFHVLPYLTVRRTSPFRWRCSACAGRETDARVAAMLAAVGLARSRRRACRASSRAASCSASPSRARSCTAVDRARRRADGQPRSGRPPA